MKLTPLDIQQHRFRSSVWGFEPKEVDAFLDVIAKEMEDLSRSNRALTEEVQRKESELRQFREREKNLKETMITATRVTEDIKVNARKEAEIVVAQAETKAEQIVQHAHMRLVRVMEDLDELKRQKTQFEETLRSMVQTHLKLLDAMSDRENGAEMLSIVRRIQKNTKAEPTGPGADDLLDPRGSSTTA